MSLRLKILLVLVVVLAGYLGFTYATLRALVIPSFNELEDRIADANVARAQRSIDTVVQFIDLTTRDWAEWDDTYAFVQHRNERFLENLVQYTYTSLEVDLILFCDREGRVIWGGGFDVAASEAFALDEVFEEPLAAGHRMLAHRRSGDRMAGLLQTRRGPMAIVSRPVLTSEATGPAAG
ncbi:MAG TPA: CHASE4 domain-containing protein, partial [Myxococcota bacterium]